MRFKLTALIVVAFVFCHGSARAQQNTNFLAAVDFSDLAFFESKGVTYKDGGQAEDGLQILKNHGINCVRLRLWTSSPAQAVSNPYNFINNTAYTVPLAVRVKNAGLLFSLDFHYSDTWADPGHQAIPNAWTNLNFTQTVQEMYYYNSNTIATFAAAGAMPDFVQIGNEITDGMLYTPFSYGGKLTGSYNTIWSQCGQLMKAAVQGIQDASNAHGYPVPKIIVHIDRGGDWATTEWFFDNLNFQGVPYDIIGESYYPFFQGSPTNLNICLSNAAIRYGKPILVAEDAFPYTNTCPSSWLTQLYGYAPTPAGQVSFVAAVGQIIRSVPNNLGYGFFYWGTEYQAANGVNEAGYNTSSFFDSHGNLLPVANAVGGMGAPFVLTQPTNLTVLTGGNVTFSTAVIGATPIIYQWQQNGTNLANGTGISGSTTTNLTLISVTANSAANYTLVITNAYGSITSSVAMLTVVLQPTITTPLTNQTIECSGNATFVINASGTPPLNYQWSLDGIPVSYGTNNDLSLTNVNLPSHTISVIISNFYASTTDSAVLTVQDTTPPVITLNGGNPIFVGLGSAFTDPGATANDTCVGSVPVVTSGAVNVNVVGINTLTYTVNDGNGNTNTATRTVIVNNTTPVIISVAANPDGSFMLSFTGTPEDTYVLETTTNLFSPNSWQPIATNEFDSSGVWQFTDTQAVHFQQQFYRLKLAP